tara:strand:+ start:496 stop:876 length:381 start_codon:yes stop_codon:yes gene_type:complete
MKRTPYKMKGYTYPGATPMKSKTESSKEMTDGAFDIVEDGTDLMKEQGFYVKGPAGSSPATKKSPAKNVGAEVAKGIDWDAITQSAVEAGVEGAVQIGASAISNSGKKKSNKGMDQSGFSKMKFGS